MRRYGQAPLMYEYTGTVVRVVDGDTVDLDIGLGLRVHTEARCRLSGINAPERNTAPGKASAAFLATIVPPGTQVRLLTFKDRTEKYGRWLAQLYVGGRLVNTALVEQGHAQEWDGRGPR